MMGATGAIQVEPSLVLRAQQGDMQAHESLYRAYGPAVYTMARRMLASSSQAEDVLQETFVEVIRKISSYRGEAELSRWIRRIAVNKCLMHLRSAWVSKRAGDDDAIQKAAAPGRERADLALDLEQALSLLPAPSRAVVWLHDVEGYTHKEIGRLMGRTASFSKSQLARAHERLRGFLAGPDTEQGADVCVQPLKTC
jgi:RNA polymerase sigma factor (sigma-70 family)